MSEEDKKSFKAKLTVWFNIRADNQGEAEKILRNTLHPLYYENLQCTIHDLRIHDLEEDFEAYKP